MSGEANVYSAVLIDSRTQGQTLAIRIRAVVAGPGCKVTDCFLRKIVTHGGGRKFGWSILFPER
jgi:hypothetical protein